MNVAEGAFWDELGPEARSEARLLLRDIIAAPDRYTDLERGYARQVSAVLDAIDFHRDVRGAVRGLTCFAEAWTVQALKRRCVNEYPVQS
jgi:hypothetical protein